MCPVLNSTSTTKITPYWPRKNYAVACFAADETIFGDFGYEGTAAVCQGGDYFIENTNIGVTTPECVGMYALDFLLTLNTHCI